MSQEIKSRVYKILESSDSEDWLSRFDDISVTVLVILDVTDFVLATSQEIYSKYEVFLSNIELIAVIYFTILYILQLWSCTADARYSHRFWGRLQYAVSPLVVIDLMAIIPFFLRVMFPHVQLIESTEILRLLRLLKLIRYSASLQTILKVINGKKDELIMTVVAVIILLIFASSIMFLVENEAQPEAFPSISAAMWWAVVTLTTVGYGDIYPVTPVGKLFGAALAFIGIGLFALPAGIIASGFSEEIQKRKRPELDAQPWTTEQQQAMTTHIEQSAELMKFCIETAKKKFGDSFENEEVIRDLAISLYKEAVGKFKIF
ncbi:potassium channel family protein [Microcoleus sp. FACHB-672]|uniref:potassium channel family protein n=1 Tax=Microcoleus sp. FACHB-672 TaxID=2692825 RepID=UPI001681F62D|nr:potassium channel family protein [Microcoleus sp. FACHB-672]MBD2042997.1 potassium channel family protein [Microcoleus sp. FACHB-672]